MEFNIQSTRVTWDCDKLIIFIFMHDVLRNQQVKCQFISLTFLKNMVHGEMMSYYTNVNSLNCYKTSFIHIKTTTTRPNAENIYVFILFASNFFQNGKYDNFRVTRYVFSKSNNVYLIYCCFDRKKTSKIQWLNLKELL